MDKQLRAFWEQQEILEKRHFTEEEEFCEEYFQKTTTRDHTGRYTVYSPFEAVLKGCPFTNL